MHPTRRATRMLATTSLAAIVVLTAACGDDDEEATADTTADTASRDDEVEFCDAVLAVETPPDPDVDFATAAEEEIADAVRVWAAEVMRPLGDDVVASAPDEIADEVEVLSAAIDEVAETGDFGAFETPEAAAADDSLNEFVADECGSATVDVTAADFRFEGVPEHVGAGPVTVRLTNEGNELHEFALFRRNDGVDQPVEELLQLPDDEVLQLVTPVGEPVFAAPGDEDSATYDLESGEYVAVCLIPVGTTSEDAEPTPDAPPHAAEGMVAEFTVEG